VLLVFAECLEGPLHQRGRLGGRSEETKQPRGVHDPGLSPLIASIVWEYQTA